MARKYFTLIELVDNKWSIQFGDYDRRVVIEERNYWEADDPEAEFRIIVTNDDQASINAKVDELNQ